MAMVKPMPPSMPAPSTCLKLQPEGMGVRPVLMQMKLAKKMPTGLPTSRPKNTPKVTRSDTTATGSTPARCTPALKKANTGKMTKFDQGASVESRRVRGASTRRETRLITRVVRANSSWPKIGSPGM